MASSKSVVIAAFIANAAIAVLKFLGFLLTGSAAMLSEVYHSISDTGNQLFLLFGIRYSGRDPTQKHPFGYGKAQFFYSFLVAVLLFGIAGWESLSHGIHTFTHPEPVRATTETLFGYRFPSHWVNYIVLLGAIAFESYALKTAHNGLTRQMHEHDWKTISEAFTKTSDVTTLTAFTEDTIAVAGAGIALGGVYLTRVTGDPRYDAAASIGIGVLLMGFSLALAWENKRLLLGESLPSENERSLKELITTIDGVHHVDDLRTVFFGPEHLLVAASVSFEATLTTEGIDERISTIETTLTQNDDQIKTVYIEPET
ncbi:cation diffusion facilitator family transporter [Halocatena salina]|uniref:Cation diffusion facilitator family transporter n=1 Tax=Halocatena salina TaxID=2934340 RepID=A0A8U0A1Z1_9EURY|nr:cation diffusion facilitator family transporter [Halocatena salina]UPM43084.1 cation diffusion facilitator family transporter [Halocatena salina]